MENTTVARGITEQVLLSCDNLINLLIVHKEFPNRTVTCRSCTEAGRQEKAWTGRSGGAKERAPADTPRDPKRDGNLQRRRRDAEENKTRGKFQRRRRDGEENKTRRPDGNATRSTNTYVQERQEQS